jgi:hypothetical protein
MAKIDSASQGKKVSEPKSEKNAAPHVVPPRTNNGETASASECQGKKKVCSCCAPVRDDTAVAVSQADKKYLDDLTVAMSKATGKQFSLKQVLAGIICDHRSARGASA